MVAASSQLFAQNIAFSAVARTAILCDPEFNEGQYAAAGTCPEVGLAVARMMVHITYVTKQLLDQKFGCERYVDGLPRMGTDFQVEPYLNHQAEIFLARFDVLSYFYLIRVMGLLQPVFRSGECNLCGSARFQVPGNLLRH